MSHRIPDDTKRAILDAARIEEVVGDFVALKKRGANYWGNCPFHQEKTPSFSVSPSKGIFKCFGCGKAGDSVTFLMEHEHMSYVEALRYLARKYNIEIQEEELTPEARQKESERESLYQVAQFAADYFTKTLWEDEEGRNVGLSYFRERKFSDAIIKQFQLGYCTESWDAFTETALKNGYDKKYLVQSGLTIEKEENGRMYDRFRGRVIFPIHSLSGRVLGFGGRILNNDKSKPKYVNSPESEIYHKSNVLYAIRFAKREIVSQDMAYMVEGYADVISLHQAGITNVVASSGTSLTEAQIKLISHFTKNLTLLYDGDPAGIKASLRGIDLVLAEDMNVRVVLLPDKQDPDDFAKEHPTEEIKQYLKDNAVDFITFKTRLLLGESGSDPIKRAEVIENIVNSISVLPDKIKRAVYLQECSRLLEISEADLLDRLNAILRKKARKQNEPQGDTVSVAEEKGASGRPEEGLEKVEEDRHLLIERELLRLLVNYGSRNTTQLYTDEEGNDAAPQGGHHPNGAAGGSVHQYKPGRAEGIAHRQAHDTGQHKDHRALAKEGLGPPHHQGDEEKADEIAAGDPGKPADAAGKAGEHRQAHRSQQQVDQHGQGTQLAPQDAHRQENGKGLQGKGHHRGDGDPGAQGNEGRHYGDVDQRLDFHGGTSWVYCKL